MTDAWMVGVLAGLLAALSDAGCGLSSSPPVDNPRFMDMWNTYEHCRLSRDTGEIRADVEKLKYIGQALELRQYPSSAWPAPIRPLLSPLPSRLSVDPDAMTRACALHGSEIAREKGQYDVERELMLVAASLPPPVTTDGTTLAAP